MRRKWWLAAVALMLAIVVGALVMWQLWLHERVADVPSSVRPALKAVLNAQLWTDLVGGYWDGEMLDQSKLIATLPQTDRVQFQSALVLYCNLDAERGEKFIDIVGNDASALEVHLKALRDNSGANLSEAQRKSVDAWIVELGALQNQ